MATGEHPSLQPHLLAMFDSSRDAIGVSKRGVHVLANPAYLRLFGYDSDEELMGRPITDLIAERDHDWVRDYVRRRSAGEPLPSLYLMHGKRKDGSEFDAETFVSTYLLGGEIHTLVTIRDVSERVRMERALRESEELFGVMSAQSLIGIAILQEDRIVYVNQAAADICGYGREVMVSWGAGDFAKLIHPEDRAFAVEQGRKKQRGESDVVVHYTYRVLTKAGRTRTIEQYSNTIQYRGRSADLVLFMDVEHRVEMEKEKQRLEAQLRQAQKMEAVGRLAGGVAHDFNNLLTAILGNVSLALVELPPGGELFDLLSEVENAAQSAAGLTRQLLAFSRKQLIEPRDLDLNDVLRRMEKMLVRVIGEDVRLETELAPELPPVNVDLAQLEQVIVNLAVNARDALPNGGHLRLGTAVVELREEECRGRNDLAPGHYVRLTVADDGVGMSAAVKQHLFEPFFTTKPKGKGTGLGLAMVFGAVTQHKGAIDVTSELGQGTTFRIHFPVSQRPGSPRALAVKPASAPGGMETILLVEDESVVRALALRILSRLGYRILAAENGMHALEVARAPAGRIDLLLTDVIMPGMNGRVLADKLVAERPGLRVLFTSGYTDDLIVAQGVLEAGLHFLAKPYGPEALARKVRELLDRPPPG